MIVRRRSGWFAPTFFLALCAGLSWFIVREFQEPPPAPLLVADGRAAVLPELPAEPSFTMAPAETFSEIIERSLFSPTRRPPVEGAVTIESPEPELDVTLVGIIITAEEQIAILKPKDGSRFLRLSEGDTFQGWTLDSIEPHRLTFRLGEIEEHIELSYEEPPPVKTPRRRKRKTQDARSPNKTKAQRRDPDQTLEQDD